MGFGTNLSNTESWLKKEETKKKKEKTKKKKQFLFWCLIVFAEKDGKFLLKMSYRFFFWNKFNVEQVSLKKPLKITYIIYKKTPL